MLDANTHPHCLVPMPPHRSHKSCCCCCSAKALTSRRSQCCPAQSVLRQAPCFHPCTQTATNQSNSVTDVTEVAGGMEYQPSSATSSRVGSKKRLLQYLFLSKSQEFSVPYPVSQLNIQAMEEKANHVIEAYHQSPRRLFPTYT